MAVQADDLMTVHLEVCYPKWLDEMSVSEANLVYLHARKKATEAFEKELDKAERFLRERKAAKVEGQMDIYDYA